MGMPNPLSFMLLGALAAGGCASIVGGQNQSLSVVTLGCEGANCELANDKGKWYVTSTPGSVTVVRSYNNLQVTCRRDGAADAIGSFASSSKGLAFGNILLGGVMGAGVDIGTGAAYDYPVTIELAMNCRAPAAASPAQTTDDKVRLGVRVEDVSQALAAELGWPQPRGSRIAEVAAGSPAAEAGLRSGDIVLTMNGADIADSASLARTLDACRPGDSVGTRLQRGREELDVRIRCPHLTTR